MILVPLVVLALQAPITAAQFIDPGANEVRREAALNAKNLALLLRTLKTSSPEVRSRPEARLAIHMVSTMIAPPKSRADWLAWMRQSERLSPSSGDEAGQLMPLLAYHVACRVQRPEAVAYLVGFSSDASSTEMQMGYTQVLMREKTYPFWRLVRDGLPVLNSQMREGARLVIGGAAAKDSPVTARRQLGLARKWLSRTDLLGVEKHWRWFMEDNQ